MNQPCTTPPPPPIDDEGLGGKFICPLCIVYESFDTEDDCFNHVSSVHAEKLYQLGRLFGFSSLESAEKLMRVIIRDWRSKI